MARRPVVHVEDGEWITIAWTGQREKCCDCDLEHAVDYQVVDGNLQFRARRLSTRKRK